MTAQHRNIALPGLFALLVFAVLVGLGLWQMERRAWKVALIDQLAHRLAAPPVDLPPPGGWALLDAANHEFRRVAFPAEFLTRAAVTEREARVYTSGSALRDDVKTPGYFAFAPARLSGGSVVVVNRGYVPNPKPDATTAPLGVPLGVVDLVGVMRWPEQREGWFVPGHSVKEDLWFARDHRPMATTKSWGAVAPFYIDLEEPDPPGGLPKPGRLKVNLANNHFQYAMTWFALAATLVGVFGVWAFGKRRGVPSEPR